MCKCTRLACLLGFESLFLRGRVEIWRVFFGGVKIILLIMKIVIVIPISHKSSSLRSSDPPETIMMMRDKAGAKDVQGCALHIVQVGDV